MAVVPVVVVVAVAVVVVPVPVPVLVMPVVAMVVVLDHAPPVRAATGTAHASPRHASTPSRIAKPAITSAATESAHAHPSREFRSRPASRAPERYAQMSVCFESAIAEAEPSSRPVRRSIQLTVGITMRLIAASAIPTGLCSGSRNPASESAASTET